MNFIDFFAGVGGFRRGLELSGHKCVGFCEWDKYATASYTSMHLITDKQHEYLSTLTLKKRQKEILKDEYRNGEWYSNDIRNVDAGCLPEADCWCFGAPCQDFSIAGKRAGLDGDRSSLIREIFRLLEEQKGQDRPEWLIYENVKGMLSSNKGLDYLSILSEMDRLGYDIEWQNINSKWFVPQNRERIYTIGHLRRYGRRKILPITGAGGENCLLQMIPGKQGQRVYDPDGISSTLSSQGGGQGAKTGLYAVKIIGTTCETRRDCSNIHEIDGFSTPLLARDYKGPKLIAIPVLTPDRAEKRQNGRRLKENGDSMFTLTAQDRHGVAISPLGCLRTVRSNYGKKIRKAYESGKLKISRHKFLEYDIKTDGCSNTIDSVQKDNLIAIKVKEATKKGYAIAKEGDSINLSVPESKTRRGRVGKAVAQTLDTSCNQGVIVQVPAGYSVYAVWYEKYQCYIAMRKLTPKECFRLQGWTDDYFERAALVNSDSQLYKQAGNGVTVDVVYAIGKKIEECEEESLERFSKYMNKPEKEAEQTKGENHG